MRFGKRTLKELLEEPGTIHPALIPGIGVAENNKNFKTNWLVFAISFTLVIALIIFGLSDPERLGTISRQAVGWVSENTGWMFSLMAVTIFVFMLVVGFSTRGRIPLGADGEKPEFSTFSWIAMLFSAGMGIGLLFYGSYEPLFFFVNTPPAFNIPPESTEAMHAAMSQTLLHWGPLAWSFYALVGGAIAYSSFRRGRPPLISAILDPIFSDRLKGPLGATIDIFTILVTLFGTAVSLGIGALQIGRGVEIIAGLGPVGNGAIVAVITILTMLFIVSAISGIKRGIKLLSNINMLLALVIALFVFIAGPTLFLLNLIPATAVSFITDLGPMLEVSGADGADAAAFMESWTTYYWAWWVSWTPFVGMFIAKISRGRTIRQFVTVVILVPSLVCLLWFGILGGTAIWMQSNGTDLAGAPSPQDTLFLMLGELPGGLIISVIAVISVTIFFITSADSAALVMGSISQNGRPVPAKSVSIVWGLSLSAIAVTLLLAGGQDSLSALQALVTVAALPFLIVLLLIMIAWWRDLSQDPIILRNKYARVAIAEGVRRGIEEHGDDFAFSSDEVTPERGAGAWLDTEDPSLSDWYNEAITQSMQVIPEPEGEGSSGEKA